MIEILLGVFYDPSKEWYEQPQELIELAIEIEQTAPINFELETSIIGHQRLKWAIWEHETEMGLFRMRVDVLYLYDVDNPAFLSKHAHNKVTIEKLS